VLENWRKFEEFTVLVFASMPLKNKNFLMYNLQTHYETILIFLILILCKAT
jgi:hypothetical protein